MLTLDAISVSYHAALPPVLDGISLTLAAGEMVAVVGANGSGKSTLARVLAGLVEPTSGRVIAHGSSAPRVGLVLQDPRAQLVGATVEHDLAFGLESQSMPRDLMRRRVREALAGFDLAALASRDPHTLSGGQQQRLAIAGVMCCDIDMLVLDEPTSQLDAGHRQGVRELVRSLHRDGLPVVWITQELEEVGMCQRVLALDHGELAFGGTPRDLFADAGRVAELGIGMPPAARMAHALAARGVTLPALPLAADELVASLGAAQCSS